MVTEGRALGTRRQNRLTTILLLASLGTLAGCSRGGSNGGSNDETGIEVPRPKMVGGVFAVADVRVVEEPAPLRFSAELPTTVAGFQETQPSTLPTTFLRHRLCAGDAEVVARFGRAVEAASATATPDELRASFGELLQWCSRPEICTWARAAVDGGGALAEVAWVGLESCGSAESDALFATDRAPARSMIAYWSSRRWSPGYVHRFLPAMVPAVKRVVEMEDDFSVRSGAILLGEGGDPEGVAAIVALHRELPAGPSRDSLVVGLVESTDPAARAIVAEHCQRPGRKDPICNRKSVVVEPMDLPGLAASSEPAAPAAPSPSVEAAEAKVQLEKLGLLWRGPLSGAAVLDEESAPTSPQEWLVGEGPVHCFDVETGQFPNDHDGLLLELAELSGPPLSQALFVEAAPLIALGEGNWLVDGVEVDRLPEGETEGSPYRLTGYLGGRSYAVDAQDLGDWYDLDQVIGLLNAMAIDQSAETRFVALPTGDQTACVLAAPKAAILAGIASGLIEVSEADAARESGKAFEGAVLEKLKSGELSLGEDD